MLRAFPSTILKNLAFTISKTNFIIYNKSLYNIPSIKTSIFFNIPFKYYFFIIFYSFFYFLSLSLSLNPIILNTAGHRIHPPIPQPPHPPTIAATSYQPDPPQPQTTSKKKKKEKPPHLPTTSTSTVGPKKNQ